MQRKTSAVKKNRLEQIKKKFKESGYKLTPQRLAVLDSLSGDTSHPGSLEIYNRLKTIYPSLSLTTVYNTLEMLSKIGEVAEITMDRTRSRYDPNTEFHDHIICIKCGKIDDVPSIEKKVVKKIGNYDVLTMCNQYFGICELCR